MPIFRFGTTIPVGSGPASSVAADFDGDGDLDLLSANYIGDTISVLFGDGLGGFVAAPSIAADSPRYLVVGDLDGDSDLDFVATSFLTTTVTMGFNNGSGGFTTSVVGGFVMPRGISLGDLDGDGDLDFASANYLIDRLIVSLNNGSGTPSGGVVLPTGNGPVRTAMSDLDGDGDLDIAVANGFDTTISIFLNNGDATFATATVVVGAGPRAITSGDIDGDGDDDLVVSNPAVHTVSVLLNNGSADFTAGASYATGSNPYDVDLGDLDGDGDLDMVVANSVSGSISAFLNDGAGGFAAANGSPFAAGGNLSGDVTLADFDEDGDLDIATSNSGSDTMSLLFNTMSNYSVSSAVSAVEGTAPGAGGVLTFTISRTATSEAEDVTYTLGGTASAGDYTAPSGTASFAIGQSSIDVQINIAADGAYEGSETVVLMLGAASGDGVISTTAGSGTATIIEDDALVIVNTPPSGTSSTIEIAEDTSYTFTLADFGFSDTNGNAFRAVTITTTPTNGLLLLDGVTVSAGQSIAAGDIDGLVWTPGRDAFGDALATIDFQVSDNGGGSDTDTTPNTITFDVVDMPDTIGGGGENNRLVGTAGADRLFAQKGNDELLGLGGDDILRSRRGNDRFWGGEGADTFIYTSRSGRDRIMDFEPGIDKIDISGWRAIEDFDDLKAHAANKHGDLWITAGKDVLIIENFSKNDLDAGDFLF